uniref:alpha/beta hydrolase family protein n=1 Tax=Escherichia coli TaxID=562 RepID=UPI0013C32E73
APLTLTDTLVSPEQSAKLFRMLKKNGDNAEYVLVEGAEHGDKTWYQPIIINRVVEWFTKNLGAPIKTAPQQQNPNANL